MKHVYEQEYKNPLFVENVKKNYIYLHKSYMKIWLDKVQAKENNQIPDFVLEVVKKEIISNRIKDIKYSVIRKILKQNKLSKYYDYIYGIIYLLTGIRFVIPDSVENDIIEMFEIYYEYFCTLKNKDRKNISYPYLLHKFFIILDMKEYTTFFPLLQNKKKLIEQEILFENVCKHVGWEFVSSI